jgi:Adenylate cyclase, family 3 (some proteins contain HAMP domain)
MPFTYRIASSASMDRLEKLIEARLKPEVNKEDIDNRIWSLFGEKWAVMYTDLSGFSRRVAEFGIIHFLQTIYESHRLLVPLIEQYGGILLKTEGDSLMIIFREVGDAIDCALAMQRCMHDYNQSLSEVEQVLLCIGIGYGDMLRIGDTDIFGADVNAASKLGEDTARPWEILITGEAMRNVTLPAGLSLESLDTAPPGADSAYRLLYHF